MIGLITILCCIYQKRNEAVNHFINSGVQYLERNRFNYDLDVVENKNEMNNSKRTQMISFRKNQDNPRTSFRDRVEDRFSAGCQFFIDSKEKDLNGFVGHIMEKHPNFVKNLPKMFETEHHTSDDNNN